MPAPNTTNEIVRSPIYHDVTRIRKDGSITISLSRVTFPNHVPGPPDSSNHLEVVVVIYFSTQMPNIDIDDVGEAVEGLVPYMLDDHISRQDTSGILHQVLKQLVFFRGQFDTMSLAFDLLCKTV